MSVTQIRLDELLARQVDVQWYEGVAIVQAICRQILAKGVSSGEFPAAAQVAITADGADEPVATLACDTDVPILSDGSEEEVRQVRMAAEEALVLASRYLAPILGRLYTDR